VQGCRASGEPMNMRYRMRNTGGSYRWYRLQGAAARDETGAIVRWAGYIADIDEQVEAELALRENAMLLEQVIETTPDMVWVIGADNRYVKMNSATARVLGVGREDLIGKHHDAFLDPEIGDIVNEQHRHILQGAEFAVEEQLFDVSRRELRLFDSRKVPLRNSQGDVTGIVGVARDITERKAIERRMRAVVDTAMDGIVVIGEDGRITSVNPATAAMFGYTEGEMLGRPIGILMPKEDSKHHGRYIGNYLRTGRKHIIGSGRQVLAQRKDGSGIPIDLSVAEWFDANRKRHFTGIMRDATDRVKSETKLRRAQDTLLSVSRLSAAGAMASTLAHELNQPLTASSNLLRSARRLLERQQDVHKAPALLQEASSEILRAGSIIRRMREYTVNGELEPESQQLVELAEAALTSIQRRPEATGMGVVWTVDPAAEPVMADRIQIEQVIVNLLRNAVEAMENSLEPTIEIEIEADGNQTALHIHDNGQGIAPDQLERLFQPFATTKDGGTGLGLAICRTIVEAHGGQIHATNRIGGMGATFSITLPVVPTGAAIPEEADA
jgi:two-component system, LuxR family, sensor kinase FixL